MGDPEYMRQQIETKLREKFRCIKLKIGALELEEEIELIQFIRESNGGKAIEIRLDANGAFSPRKAAKVLEKTGIKMGINKPEAHGTLGNGCMAKLYKVMIRLITNQDENDDGIDDRYQSTSYNREMTRRGSIISSSGLDRSGTINVLQSDDLKLLQEKQNAEKELYPDKEKEQVSSEDAERNAKSTLNWE